MPSKKIVSIIVPVHNAQKYLNDCVSSIFQQTYNNFELILIDDGSSDNSPSMCDSYGEGENVIVIHQLNQGVSSARNTGLLHAKGDYILFLDSDDYLEKNYLYQLVQCIENNDADIAICNINIVNDSIIVDKMKTHDFSNNVFYIDDSFNYNKNPFALTVCGKLFQKVIINDVKFNSKFRIGEDALFMAECLKKCNKVAFSNDTSYFYRMNPTSVMHEKYSDKCLDQLLVWNEIENLFQDKIKVWKSCRIKYLKACKRIGVMIQKENNNNKLQWEKYSQVVRKNIYYVITGNDYLQEKIKLLLFAFLPNLHFRLFNKYGKKY